MIGRALEALKALIGSTGAALAGGISLVPRYLANLLWLIDAKFYALAREGYGGNSVVYSCLRLLALSVPEPPLLCYQLQANGEREPLPATHPLALLIARPNELMTEWEMHELTTLFMGHTGRACWFKERANNGLPAALWPLRPDRVGPIYSLSTEKGERVIQGWSYLLPGTSQYVPLARADVLTFNFPDPAGESGGIVEGLGPMQVVSAEVSADNTATRFVGTLLANRAVPGVVIQTQDPLPNREAAQRIKSTFKEQFGGSQLGDVAVIDASATVTPVGFNLRELEFPDLRRLSETRICAAFGVPPILVGLQSGLERSTYSNIAEAREDFAERTCQSYWRRYETQFTVDLASEFGPNLVCEFDRRQVKALSEQSTKQAQPIKEAFQFGAVTVNEYRQSIGLGPVAGGDVRLEPTTSAEVAGLLEADAAVKRSRRAIPAPFRKAFPLKASAMSAKSITALAQRTRDKAVPHLARELERAFAAQGKSVVQKLRASAKAVPVLLDDSADSDLLDVLDPHYRGVLQDAYGDASLALDTSIGWDVSNPRIKDILDQVGNRVGGINDTTRQDIRHLVDLATEQGTGVDALADALTGMFDETYKGRALAIARTETANAYSLGAVAAYRDSGVVDSVTVLDGDGDEECAAADGQTWTLDEAEAEPIAHPNCTRSLLPNVSSGAD